MHHSSRVPSCAMNESTAPDATPLLPTRASTSIHHCDCSKPFIRAQILVASFIGCSLCLGVFDQPRVQPFVHCEHETEQREVACTRVRGALCTAFVESVAIHILRAQLRRTEKKLNDANCCRESCAM